VQGDFKGAVDAILQLSSSHDGLNLAHVPYSLMLTGGLISVSCGGSLVEDSITIADLQLVVVHLPIC
jgi:hypothetical protein